MKLVAQWAGHNKRSAQIIIAVSHFIIAGLACYVGVGLQSNNIYLPVEVFWTATALVVSFHFIFRHSNYRKLLFSRRKLIDILVGVCSFIMIASSANQTKTNHFVFYNPLHGALPEKVEPVKKGSVKDLKKQWKEIKALAKKEGGASAGSIVLAILVGWILVGLVGALACTAACNNQGALAVLILIGGLTGVFFVIKAIIKGSARRRRAQS